MWSFGPQHQSFVLTNCTIMVCLHPVGWICFCFCFDWNYLEWMIKSGKSARKDPENELCSYFTRWGRLWGLSTRHQVQNGETTRYKSWANFLRQNQYLFVKGCQSWKGNAGLWWQWCVTAELTNSGIGISEVWPSRSRYQGIGHVASDFSGRTCMPWKKATSSWGKI